MSNAVQGQKKKETAKDDFLKQFKNPKQPDDFKTKLDFLKFATKLFDDDLEADKKNREQAITDAKFMVGEQWEPHVSKERQAAKKPVMVFNRLPAFVGQVAGNRRLNETVIKVLADDAKYKDTAKIREGLIRSIQKISRADIAYYKALENQVICGIGNFDVTTEYAYDDVFEQDIKINAINNTFSVVWDHQAQDPTGRDANHVFQVETMTHAQFKDQYPNANPADPSTNTQILGYDLGTGWVTVDEVRVVNFWRMRSRKRIVALLREEGEDGKPSEDVEDVTDKPVEEWAERVVTNAAGVPVMREVDRKFAQLYVFSASDLLQGPFELPISRVPVFRVPGWDINVGEERHRFGLIRFLKDPQRLHNFWRSVIAENLMKTPKAVWVATQEAIEGREKEWKESHLSDNALLVWNGESGQKPERIQPARFEAALIQEAGMAAQDLRDISNIHEASLGQKSNEVSGKAILARQRVGETGTIIYQDNLNSAIEEAGRVINELIPHVYDTTRTIKILGEEGEDLPAVVINDETDKEGVDITAGKYSVTSVTGPSTVTKRVEAQENMLNMVNAMPDTLGIVADKIIEAQEWPGAKEITRRLRLTLPPGMIKFEDMTDEQKKAAQAAQEQAQIEQKKADIILAVELDEKKAKTNEANARAVEAQAKAAAAMERVDVEKFKALAEVEDARIKTILQAVEQFDKSTQPKDA